MALEIERKFLVAHDGWKKDCQKSVPFRQGYLPSEKKSGITMRIRTAGTQGFLTVKGPARNMTRTEYEYEIPFADAESMLNTMASGMQLRKIRNYVPAGSGLVWEIDEYFDGNAGLVTAELELPSEDTPWIRPPWLGKEVTGIPRYYNSMLSIHPWNTWTVAERAGQD